MIRIALAAALAAAALSGCGPGPEPAGRFTGERGTGSAFPVQESGRPEITAERISKDVVGKSVEVPELSGSGPNDRWTFEAGEFRSVEVVERHATANGVDLVVFMLTRSVPKAGAPEVQVTGRLRLHYEWRSRDWVLRRIENVNFRYSVGVAT